MEYILKNKDLQVLTFSTKMQNNFVYLDEVKIINNTLLPYTLDKNNLKTSFQKWIENRKIPKHRQFAQQILANLGVSERNNFLAYIDISFGLSLNDSFWIIPSDKDYKWSDYNLYDNEFDEALQLTAFGMDVSHNGSTSPEYTTNGMLKKCWSRQENQIYLYKGSMQGEEVFSEYYSCQIAQALGFNAIAYDLKEFHGQIVSTCPIFTNENEGYLPINVFIPSDIQKDYKAILADYCKNIYGKELFEDLMVFDAIVGNKDRHLGNFGMIVDNNTNEILYPAPIFDNGLGILGWLDKNEPFESQTKTSITYFDYKFNEQLILHIQPRHFEGLQKLKDFKFEQHSTFKIDEKMLEFFNSFVQEKAKYGIEFLQRAPDSSALNAIISEEQKKIQESKKQENSTKEHNNAIRTQYE